MPLIVFLVCAWLLGTITSALKYSAFTNVSNVIPVLTLGVACLGVFAIALLIFRRATRPAVFMAVATISIYLAAFTSGSYSWLRSHNCLRTLANVSVEIIVRVDEDISPGEWVRGSARGVDETLRTCHVPVTMSVKHGTAEAGAWVRVDAIRLSSGNVLRLDEATVSETGSSDRIHGWRSRKGYVIDSLFRDNAPLVRALLIADQDGIDIDVRDRFAASGLIHVLSISGLHVSIIASAMLILCSILGMRADTSRRAALLCIGIYIILLGFPAPAVRAAGMLATIMLIRGIDRPVHPWTALAIGVTLPTFDTQVVVSLGWQLSAAGMASLVASRTIVRRWRATPLNSSKDDKGVLWNIRMMGVQLSGWKLSLVTELLAGIVACLVTAPLVAWYFGRVSLISPVANIFASPIVAFLQPILFLALLFAPLKHISSLLADASIVPLELLDIIATITSSFSHSSIQVAPGKFTAICMGIAASALITSTVSRRVFRSALVASVAFLLALWVPLFQRGNGFAELHMIDVGQGDALAIRTPKGRWIIIDAGRVWKGGDAGRRVVVPYIKRLGGEVIMFILTHPDADHVGGAASVIAFLKPKVWWDPGFVHGSEVYSKSLETAILKDVLWRKVTMGDSVQFDGIDLKVLSPDTTMLDRMSSNDASIVLMMTHGKVKMILTGDAEKVQEDRLIRDWGDDLRAHILKVGHHGSRTSSSSNFLDIVDPEIALISVGAGNRFGHPAPEVSSALRARRIDILRTDRDGSIVVRSDGNSVKLQTRHTGWSHSLIH